MGTKTGEKLLDAVARVLSDGGVTGLSLRKVARVAGVSHAAPGVVFGDKAGLLTAYAIRGFRLLDTRMTESIRDAPDGPAALARCGQAYIAFALEYPSAFEVMYRGDLVDLQSSEYVTAADTAYTPLRDAVVRCLAEGFVAEESARDTAVTAWALVHGLVVLWNSKHMRGHASSSDPTELGVRVTELYTGLLRRPET